MRLGADNLTMLYAVSNQPPTARRPATVLQRVQSRPVVLSDTLELSDRCMLAPATTPLPVNDDLKLKGDKPKLTDKQRLDLTSLEANQQRMVVGEIKADATIMAALQDWGSRTEAQKLAVLRRIAALEGQVYHFTPAPMTLDRTMAKGDYGAYDGDARTITLGAWGLADREPRELVDTVIHEQLHALQHQRYTAMKAGKIAPHNPLNAQAREWLYNSNHYHAFEQGPKAYRQQPVEAHAWDGAGAIVDAIFGAK
ncbi:MAG: hypothetical protein JWM80_4497 [Cyanobacteria bacterium RYN_339]|nr:hypothetical protein [Cyanobacteria bacterium RYN_339]